MKRTVIVTGGREYADYLRIRDVLNLINPDKVVQGGAAGADALAKAWAISKGVPCDTIKANWDEHGRAAGPIRNREMIQWYATAIIVAFPGGRGTENCVKTAIDLGRLVLRVEK